MARLKLTQAVLFGQTGAGVDGATVTVYLRGTTTLATLYAGETGTTTVANPLTTVHGRMSGWADEGSYDFVVSYGTIAPYTQPVELQAASASLSRLTTAEATIATLRSQGTGGDATALLGGKINVGDTGRRLNQGSLGGTVRIPVKRSDVALVIAGQLTANTTIIVTDISGPMFIGFDIVQPSSAPFFDVSLPQAIGTTFTVGKTALARTQQLFFSYDGTSLTPVGSAQASTQKTILVVTNAAQTGT